MTDDGAISVIVFVKEKEGPSVEKRKRCRNENIAKLRNLRNRVREGPTTDPERPIVGEHMTIA